ncbi:hypothetical protein [Pedobacter metabolipauper]|uniref:Uncharacterized protein n=1 Tax=Pedobacter metabolipauper TaxID=425513 RepID=A0A4R6STW5_9SPHI|nr:hypothetical protein [Pedobacter metabolipauper]TDQ08406.1 hypothetical protein ATK78_2919 [Pedobacter metabolipauper]
MTLFFLLFLVVILVNRDEFLEKSTTNPLTLKNKLNALAWYLSLDK